MEQTTIKPNIIETMDDKTDEMMCPKCSNPMHKEGNLWKCDNCGHTIPTEEGSM